MKQGCKSWHRNWAHSF